MGSATLSLLILKTRRVDDLGAFYGALGVELGKERHGKGPAHYAGRVGDVVLEIYPQAEDGVPTDATTRLGFAVEKPAEVLLALQTLGAVIVNEGRVTEWGFRAVVRDPDGRVVELYQR